MPRTDESGARFTTDDVSIELIRYPTELVLILSTSRTLSNWREFVPPESIVTEDETTRIGGWLFRHRTWLPLPAAIAILTLRIGEAPPSPFLVGIGVGVTVLGELIRLWGVNHIGAISRTRSERLGPLVASGPFALIRNPLYVGNIALWAGFALTARLVWLAPVILLLLALEYHAIVRWEETLLDVRLGQAYRDYARRVPRWIPTLNRGERGLRRSKDGFSWRATLFSERGTFIAIAIGYLVLWLKLS
jgi:protein-S-isoprenylcysteine O-methyltransferase Ste14